jgi:RHS repeat-associated protein
MTFDHQGRRREYLEVAANGSTNRHNHFTYDNYLQIANCNLQHAIGNLQLFVWDPTEPVATRPLVFYQPNAPPQLYAHDGNKNVSELVASDDGSISAHYEYAPFGEVILSSGDLALANPFRFSSEYSDDALGLVYYNYRHYELVTGRWLQRDFVREVDACSLYGFVKNECVSGLDILGLFGDGYMMVCVEWKKVSVRTSHGQYRMRKVCKKWIKQNLPWKGHSQFTNNGTECPFDYTKEDYGWSSPYIMPRRHFQDKPESESKVNAAISACNANAFERAMHQLQDYFTHRGKGYEWHKGGHIFDGTKPDEDNEAWDKAEKETKKWIKNWDANCCLGCPKKDCKWIKKSERKCAE